MSAKLPTYTPVAIAAIGSTFVFPAFDYFHVEQANIHNMTLASSDVFPCVVNYPLFPVSTNDSVILVSGVEKPLKLRFAESDAASYELDQGAINILGVNSYRRLQEFRKLKSGWSFGGGNPLSLKSMENMEFFLKCYGENILREYRNPLIFLNREGEIELLWKKDEEAEVFVRFHDCNVDYLVSPGDFEGTGETGSAGLVIQKAINSKLAA